MEQRLLPAPCKVYSLVSLGPASVSTSAIVPTTIMVSSIVVVVSVVTILIIASIMIGRDTRGRNSHRMVRVASAHKGRRRPARMAIHH